MVAGKLFTNPMRGGPALPYSFLVGNGMSPVLVSWHSAVNDKRETIRRKLDVMSVSLVSQGPLIGCSPPLVPTRSLGSKKQRRLSLEIRLENQCYRTR
jgi:hypothetical protein